MSSHYNSQRGRRSRAPMTTAELVATGVTLVAIVACIVLFLTVFHDFPLRVV